MPTCDSVTDVTPVLGITPPTRARTWRVVLVDGSTKTVTATACRTEHACLLFCEPAGMTVALAAGSWSSVEMVTE